MSRSLMSSVDQVDGSQKLRVESGDDSLGSRTDANTDGSLPDESNATEDSISSQKPNDSALSETAAVNPVKPNANGAPS